MAQLRERRSTPPRQHPDVPAREATALGSESLGGFVLPDGFRVMDDYDGGVAIASIVPGTSGQWVRGKDLEDAYQSWQAENRQEQ